MYIRVFPHKSITSIPLETRMGKGKGEPEYWAAVVRPGTILYEIGRRDRGGGQDVLRPPGPQDADPRADGPTNAVSKQLQTLAGELARREN